MQLAMYCSYSIPATVRNKGMLLLRSSSEAEHMWFAVQVRLLDGSALTATFKAQEPLAAVRVYIQMNGGSDQDFTLLSPYPRRVYTELDMEKPLRELGETSQGVWPSEVG